VNCRPGDIAVFINPENAGRMVRVIGPSLHTAYVNRMRPGVGACWSCEALSAVHVWINGESDRPEIFKPGDNLPAVPDRQLRPLRPGEDDVDTVRELFTPSSTEVA
jgi:hypothetical protein